MYYTTRSSYVLVSGSCRLFVILVKLAETRNPLMIRR